VQDVAKYQAHCKHDIDTDQNKPFFDEADQNKLGRSSEDLEKAKSLILGPDGSSNTSVLDKLSLYTAKPAIGEGMDTPVLSPHPCP
jgi:hypothetical protein